MKNNKQRKDSNHKRKIWPIPLLCTVAVALMICSGWLTANWLRNLEKQNHQTTTPELTEEDMEQIGQSTADQKEKIANSTTGTEVDKTKLDPDNPEESNSQNSNESKTVQKANIQLYAEPVSGEDGYLHIRTEITPILNSNITCNLTLIGKDYVVRKTTTIQAMPSMSTCAGFDVGWMELDYGPLEIIIELIDTDNQVVGRDEGEIEL